MIMPHKDDDDLHWVQGGGGAFAGGLIGFASTGTPAGAAIGAALGGGAGILLGEQGIDLIDRD